MTGVANASRAVDFYPGAIQVGNEYAADPGTAGSISLLLQVSLPCLLFQPHSPVLADTTTPTTPSSTLVLRGGTNASNAPQIDYAQHVFIPFLTRHFGISPRLKVIKRGYYPRGGGLISLNIPPLPPGTSLPPISLTSRGTLKRISGKSYVAGSLPIHLARKMTQAATRTLSAALSLDTKDIDIECVKEAPEDVGAGGSGSGIVLWAETDTGCVLGGSALGSKRKDPATVGDEAAQELIRGLEAGGCVDEYMQDQIVIFLALAHGTSVVRTGMPLTLHTRTAIWIAEQLTDAKFQVEGDELGSTTIRCNGIGYTSQPF